MELILSIDFNNFIVTKRYVISPKPALTENQSAFLHFQINIIYYFNKYVSLVGTAGRSNQVRFIPIALYII